MLPEKEIIKGVKNHDPEAFGKLYDLYFDQIYNYIYWRVGNQPDAEDLTEQVFLRALEAIDNYKWRGVPISAWLFQIARNFTIDHFRTKARTQVRLEKEIAKAEEARSSASAEETALGEIDYQHLQKAIAELTEEQQQVIILKFFVNLSNLEVSKILEKTVGSVKSLQHRALASLARIFERRGEDE